MNQTVPVKERGREEVTVLVRMTCYWTMIDRPVTVTEVTDVQ